MSAHRAPSYVQVNIGRNVNDVPMSDNEWINFRAAVSVAIRDSVLGNDTIPKIEFHSGVGEYKGIMEESMHISIVARIDRFVLRKKLLRIKELYKQDAIALITNSELL